MPEDSRQPVGPSNIVVDSRCLVPIDELEAEPGDPSAAEVMAQAEAIRSIIDTIIGGLRKPKTGISIRELGLRLVSRASETGNGLLNKALIQQGLTKSQAQDCIKGLERLLADPKILLAMYKRRVLGSAAKATYFYPKKEDQISTELGKPIESTDEKEQHLIYDFLERIISALSPSAHLQRSILRCLQEGAEANKSISIPYILKRRKEMGAQEDIRTETLSVAMHTIQTMIEEKYPDTIKIIRDGESYQAVLVKDIDDYEVKEIENADQLKARVEDSSRHICTIGEESAKRRDWMLEFILERSLRGEYTSVVEIREKGADLGLDKARVATFIHKIINYNKQYPYLLGFDVERIDAEKGGNPAKIRFILKDEYIKTPLNYTGNIAPYPIPVEGGITFDMTEFNRIMAENKIPPKTARILTMMARHSACGFAIPGAWLEHELCEENVTSRIRDRIIGYLRKNKIGLELVLQRDNTYFLRTEKTTESTEAERSIPEYYKFISGNGKEYAEHFGLPYMSEKEAREKGLIIVLDDGMIHSTHKDHYFVHPCTNNCAIFDPVDFAYAQHHGIPYEVFGAARAEEKIRLVEGEYVPSSKTGRFADDRNRTSNFAVIPRAA